MNPDSWELCGHLSPWGCCGVVGGKSFDEATHFRQPQAFIHSDFSFICELERK